MTALTRTASLWLAACFALPGPALASEHPFELEYMCAADVGPIGSCTANDIYIADASNAVPAGGIVSCTAGEMVEIEALEVRYGINASQRYDPLLWVGIDGNDPRVEAAGDCFVSAVPNGQFPDIFQHLDGDSCLDVNSTGEETIEYGNTLMVPCQDSDGDGIADMHAVVTWQQNTNQDCGNVDPEFFGLGAPSKCNYSLLPLGIDFIDTSLTVEKVIVSDNGGTATLADFDVEVDGVDVDWTDPASTTGGSETVASAAGTYTLSELGLAGYAEGNWACIDQDEVPVPVTNGGAFDGADVEVAEGQQVFCSITNDDIPPELTVIKHVVNDSGGGAAAGQWTMEVTAANPSANNFPGAEAPGTTITIDAGAYSVDESGGPAGYLKSLGANCSGSLDVGESATCTITNDDIAPELTVIVAVTNDDGGTAVAADWAVDVTAANPSDTGFPGAEAPGTTITLDAGVYSVALSGGPEDYSIVPGPGCAGTLDPGATASCTFTVDDLVIEDPQLTIIKHVVNDNGGSAVAGQWTMDVTATNPSANNFPGAEAPGVTITIDPGAYSVDESGGPGGYQKTLGPGCSGSLAVNETATCTITNDDIAPGLTIIVTVINDDEGTAEAADWTVDVAAINPSATGFPGAAAPGTSITIDAGPYSVSLSGGPGGYNLTPDADCAGVLGPGGSATCTITADDDDIIEPAAELTVIKHVINDDEGTAAAADWTMVVTATNPSMGSFPGAEAPGTTITLDPGPYSVDETGGPDGYQKTLGPGCAGVLGSGESATCTIINDDADDGGPAPDIRVTKSVTPALTPSCPVVIGETLDFVITVSNAGDAAAEGVKLDEQWSWQLKPEKSPDLYECSEPKPHSRRCKLGDMEPGASIDIAISFMVGGTPAPELCNTAIATSNPAETDTVEDNQGQVCFESIERVSAQCDDLAEGLTGVYYEQEVNLTGGEAPTATGVDGLPGNLAGESGNPVLIEGCPVEPGQFSVVFNVSDTLSCQEDVQVECPLTIVRDPSCALAELAPIPVEQIGIPTPTPDVLPDESVQKLVVEPRPPEGFDSDRPYRYLVGFGYARHAYGSDPNGPYLNPADNYDIRLAKYSDSGELLWSRTYDTGNDDYGYAVALSPDQQTVYVGGGALRESGPHAWMDAVLLEIDAASGCLVGDHFQGAAQGTTSVYYDIAATEDVVYAVGERQVNPGIPADLTERGGLVSAFMTLPGGARNPGCDNQVIIPGENAGELAWDWNIVREAVAGLEPVTAYSVQLPDRDCEDCGILVAGGAGPDGWLEHLDPGDRALEPFVAISDLRIQDIAVHGQQIVAVGSSAANDMRIVGLERDGSASWPELQPGKGRLRGVTADAAGYFYAVGTGEGDGSSGLVFKVSPSGVEVDRDQLGGGDNTFFNDVGVFEPGFGTIAAQVEESGHDYGWMQVEFTCDPSCE